MSRYAVIGDPVAQSVSPPMHRAAFASVGLPHEYEAVRVPREELGRRFEELTARFTGMNVTTPLKEAVLPLLDRVAPDAAAAGSVNTVVREGGELVGHSTDGAGFLSALRGSGVDPAGLVSLVFGTGGAARAVAAALRDAGADVLVLGRNSEAGALLSRDLGVSFRPTHPADALMEADLVVNATPVDPCPHVELHRPQVVVDLVYRPRRTPFLERAALAGARTVEGVETLVGQGALSFELWTGRPAPVQAMREAATAALDQPAVRGTAS